MMLTILVAVINLLTASHAQATSIDLALPDKFDYCAVVAEVTIESVQTGHDDLVMLDELTCKARVVRPFKGCQSNDVISLYFHRLDTNTAYISKTFLVFAFEQDGQLRPFGAQEGLIEKGHEYEDPILNAGQDTAGRRTLTYADLLNELERKKTANKAFEAIGDPGSPQPQR